MSRPKGSRHNGAMLASEQAKEWLRQDLPQAVRVQLLLAVRGGRQPKRRCLGCGGAGTFVQVYVPNAVMRPMSDGGEGIRLYWLCEPCHTRGLTSELEQKLQR
jgi:hypothetical protein